MLEASDSYTARRVRQASKAMAPRRRMMHAACLVAGLCLSMGLSAQVRPNIVVIFADDLGWGDVGFHGGEIRTPQIDALASSGARLQRYYAYPLCNPTRAAFLTGRSPLRMGIERPGDPGLPTSERTLAEALRESGYTTWICGKWHLGHRHVRQFPNARGFDHAYGCLGAGIDSMSHLSGGGALDWNRNGKSVREEGHATDLIAKEAISKLEAHDRKQPFFLFLAFNAPHTPLAARDDLLESYAHIEDEARRLYAATVTQLDEAIGRVVAKLDALGLREDTIVVWASDNGGTRRCADNTPLRGNKSQVFEGGVRVPAIVSWPGRIRAGAVCMQRTQVIDWMPTLLAISDSLLVTKQASREPRSARRALDGRNVGPVLLGKARPFARDFAITLGAQRAYFRGRFKLVDDGRAQYLYDLDTDPRETRDLASERPGLVATLDDALARFVAEASDEAQRIRAAEPEALRGRGRRGTGFFAGRRGAGSGFGARRQGGLGPGGLGRFGRRGGFGNILDPFARFTQETRDPIAESAARN